VSVDWPSFALGFAVGGSVVAAALAAVAVWGLNH
jgi:hypothetical protein